jgi:hypothetical protein
MILLSNCYILITILEEVSNSLVDHHSIILEGGHIILVVVRILEHLASHLEEAHILGIMVEPLAVHNMLEPRTKELDKQLWL